MAASAAGGTAPYASAAGPYSGISAASIPDLYTGFPDYGLLSTTTGQLQHSLTAISACNLPPAQPVSMHDPFIPGAICNQTLEQLIESAQPVIRECPPQRRSVVIAAQHQSLAAATSAATAEPRARRSPVTRRHQRQQQRHSESPESALPQASQSPCSSSTSLSSPPSSHTVFLDIMVILLLHASCIVSCNHSQASPHAARCRTGVSSVPRCSSHVSSSLCPYRRICRNPISSYKALSQLDSCHPIMWHPITLS